jgi:type I restriction enzyme, S subunit
MTTEAERVPFRSLLQYAIGGGWGTDGPSSDDVQVRVIRGTDFSNLSEGRFNELPLRYEKKSKVASRALIPGDLVIEISGGSSAKGRRSCYVSSELLSRFDTPVIPASFCRLVRTRKHIVEPRYAYFALQDMHKSGRAFEYENRSTGISNFQFEHFLDAESVRLPPLIEQRAIANILGTLDDKIELNRRTNETLEAIARAIFKSWFVDFDPVRAKASGEPPVSICRRLALTPDLLAFFPSRLVDSELGEIPEGWEVRTLGDFIDIFDSKRIPLSSREREKRKGPYPYYGAAAVMDYVDDFLFQGIYVLMGEDGSVVNADGTPVLQYVWGKFWVNNHAHVLRARSPISNEQLLLLLRRTNIASLVTGAVQAKLSQANLRSIEFVRAPDLINESFGRLAGPIFELIRSHAEESEILADVRDALLPALLSGRVRAPFEGFA